MKNIFLFNFILFCGFSGEIKAQYFPKNSSQDLEQKAQKYTDSLYSRLSLDEKIGQLYIVALYTNKDEAHISSVRNLVEKEKIGGVILMQDDALRELTLVKEFQKKSRIPMLFGMDAEWGLSQRIKGTHKFPWAMTLGAIKDNSLIYKMGAKIAQDAKKLGVYWNFAPVVDVNTNPKNPIIGNRSFGSDVQNVIRKSLAYAEGLQDNGVLAAIKHFPGHGDTDVDSHLDLPVVSHSLERLEQVELAPFRELMDKKIGGVMVAHLYVPVLESRKNVPASVSYEIITDLLKNKFRYNGLIITDALNMNAVSKRYSAGQLDLLAFKAGNDVLLFSQDVPTGKKLIKQAILKDEITEKRLEESVKKILKTKYLLGLHKLKSYDFTDVQKEFDNDSHKNLTKELYSNALTLLKDDKKLLPLKGKEIYYMPLEEAAYQDFITHLNKEKRVLVKKISPKEIHSLPANSTVIIGLHKDNSTAYKPYKISETSKKIISEISKRNPVILNVFGSPYALRDIDIKNISTVLVSYENNQYSMKATAEAYLGKYKIHGRLPVIVNDQLSYGMGIDLEKLKTE